MELTKAAQKIGQFQKGGLTRHLSKLEAGFHRKNAKQVVSLCADHQLDGDLVDAAFTVKNLAKEINVIIHAVGILISLPHILTDSEIIETLSLGAGNTGRKFDLETDQKIAEFKFINWQGGPESIRQNALFKDFFELAEHDTEKERFLYLLERERPINFLTGNRALKSVLSRHVRLKAQFYELYGNRYERVGEYYGDRKNKVTIVDLTALVPELENLANLML